MAMMIVFSGRYINLTFIGVVFFNTIIGIIQELKVKKTIDELSIVMDQSVLVRRNGQDEIINSDKLVLIGICLGDCKLYCALGILLILLLYGIHFQKVLLSRTACIMRQKSLAESLCMRYNLSMLKDRR